MTTGGIFSLGAVRNWFLLCSELPETWLSGVGDDGKAVLLAVSIILGFILVLLCFFLEVMTVKSSTSAISSRFGGSEEAVAGTAGFCTPCLVALVPPWEQCTSAATTTF
jgi:hypothetical protein